MFRILFALLMLPCLGFAGINEQLTLILDIQPGDSVVSITRTGTETIEVRVVGGADVQERILVGTATSRIMERLKATAEAESIPWTVKDFQPEPATGSAGKRGSNNADSGGGEGEWVAGEKVTASALSKNKFRYVSTQTVFSTYTYGLALPIAFEAPDKAAALGLLALPVSFGAHYFVAWDKDYHDAHLFATSYFASNSLIFSYALPFLALGPDFNAFRIGTFAVMAAYPLSLHYGYKHGTRFQDEPGRVSLQSSFAFTSGMMGYFGILLWARAFEEGEVGVRLAVAQVLGAGIAGHYLSYNYRTHEIVPGGIGPGIGTFSLLGGLLAGCVVATAEPESPEAFGSILLAGVGAGFFGGQKFFFDKYDTFERSAYNSLGLAAGAVTPLGFMLLTESFPEEPAAMMWTLTGGAFAGYFLTRMATSSLVEKPRSHAREKGFFKTFAFNPVPVPVPENVDGRHSIKLVAPLLTATF
jgi:hypothetical protein